MDFPLYHGSARSLKKTLAAAASGRFGRDTSRRVVVQALRDISFTLTRGDRLGLIGTNGAGKTTLLRTLAGIYEPVVGRVRIDGTLNALLDPNSGMNMDLTGRENIMLRGLYNGYSAEEIASLEEDVQLFAELGHFMDLPVRLYSSGMVVRLGFGLATAIQARSAADGRVVPRRRPALHDQGAQPSRGHGAWCRRAGALDASGADPGRMVQPGDLDGPWRSGARMARRKRSSNAISGGRERPATWR